MTKSTITREPITHDLKIYPELFSAVCTGVKRAELRKNDRDYVMVPKEPTDEMQSAGASAIRIETTALNKLWTGNAVFRAMLAAAPQEVKP